MSNDKSASVEVTSVPTQSEQYFSQYDDLAVELLSDNTPMPFGTMNLSPAIMAERVCVNMGWEDFDLLEPHPFEEFYDRGTMPQIFAYALIARLRELLFLSADSAGVGLPKVNETAIAHSQRWCTLLIEKWSALRSGNQPAHRWNN